MKTLIKYTLLLVSLALISLVIYQNLDYFMTKNTLSLTIDKLNYNWTSPALQNLFFFGICFIAGLFLSGFKGLLVKWVLEEKLESKEKELQQRDKEIEELKTKLDVFTHDPYIKKGLEEQKALTQLEQEKPLLPESSSIEQEPPTDPMQEDQTQETAN